MINCLCFGDSITFGEYDGIFGGWVDILKRYFHLAYTTEGREEVNVFNLGKGGETSEGIIKRISVESEARQSPDKNIIFISYGANDLAQINGVYQVDLVRYQQNLAVAIDKAKNITSNVFLLNILPMSSRIAGITLPNGKLRDITSIIQYNAALRALSTRESVGLVDTHQLFLDHNYESLLSKDGLHPNEQGYTKIADKIKPIIQSFY